MVCTAGTWAAEQETEGLRPGLWASGLELGAGKGLLVHGEGPQEYRTLLDHRGSECTLSPEIFWVPQSCRCGCTLGKLSGDRFYRKGGAFHRQPRDPPTF